MTHDGGPPARHLQPVDYDEPPHDPEYGYEPLDQGPSNPEHSDRAAEHAILATLITTPTTHDTLTTELEPNDFYWPTHETIWNAWHNLHQTDGVPPDAIVLAAHLNTTRQHEAARLVTDLITIPTIPGQATSYARIVRDHARLRDLAHIATQLAVIARNGTPDTINTAMAEAVDRLDETAMRFGGRSTHATHNHWAPLNLEAVLAGQEVDPPPDLLARSDGKYLFYTGAIHTVSGEPGSGKTWVTLVAALQQLEAGNTVTMIDFEDRASRVIGRLLGLGARPEQIRDHFRYIRPHAALDPNLDRSILQAAVSGTSLVILDGVTEAMTLHGLDLNANADVATFYSLLPRWIADHGPAVVMIDHVVKDGEKQGRWALGGQHKLAGIDGVAYLVKAIEPFGRGKEGLARITVSKDRPGYVEEIALGRTVAEFRLDARDINCLRHHLDAPSALSKDDAGNMRPTHLMEKVSRYVEITPGLGKNELADGRISGKREYIKRAIDRLVQEGYLEVATGPNRKQAHRSITAFREDEDALHANAGWASQEPLA